MRCLTSFSRCSVRGAARCPSWPCAHTPSSPIHSPSRPYGSSPRPRLGFPAFTLWILQAVSGWDRSWTGSRTKKSRWSLRHSMSFHKAFSEIYHVTGAEAREGSALVSSRVCRGFFPPFLLSSLSLSPSLPTCSVEPRNR